MTSQLSSIVSTTLYHELVLHRIRYEATPLLRGGHFKQILESGFVEDMGPDVGHPY